MINVGELIEYSGKVPEWVTGIQGNPLAGLMGLVFLSAIARWVRGQTVKNTPVNIP